MRWVTAGKGVNGVSVLRVVGRVIAVRVVRVEEVARV
jgi:hypothetical protein